MSKTLDLIRNHRAVESISVEDGGDLIMVYLNFGYNRYGRCSDGYTKGFHRESGQTPTDALNWVRREVGVCTDPECERCTGNDPYYLIGKGR